MSAKKKATNPVTGKLKEVTNQDVLEYLESQKNEKGFTDDDALEEAVKKVTTPLDPADLSEEDRKSFDPESDEDDEEKPEVDTPMNPEMLRDNASDVMDFMLDLEGLGTIEVTEGERDLYVKTLINDVPYELDIEVFKDLYVRVRSRTVHNDELVYDMIREDIETKDIIGVESSYTRIQQYLLCFQVTRIAGKDVAFNLPEGIDRTEARRLVKEHHAKHYDNMVLPKWRALVKAVLIFDAKQKICNDKLLDKTFWEGASIG